MRDKKSPTPAWPDVVLTPPGEVVTVLDGPNVTLLRRKVLEECEKEELIAAGAGSRTNIAIQDAVPGKLPRFQGRIIKHDLHAPMQ